MHELSVVQSIVSTTTDFLEENSIGKISFLTLIIGESTGVIPQYVRMYYKDVCEGTKLENSELRIEEVRTEYFCRDCGNVFHPRYGSHHHLNRDHCPKCDSEDLEVIAGNELMIKEVGYE